MLELKNVKKFYKTKSGEVAALNGVSLTFPSSGMVFISGKSGCGKTTLLNVVGGIDGIDEGEISLLGKSFESFSQGDYDDYRNTFIGFIFQEYNLLSEFTVEKNIEIAMELQGRKSNREEVDALLKEMEIEGLRNRKPSELSGGQRQRVAIARALVKNPRIIMADEPTGALDSNTGIQVLDILKKLSKEKLVIVVSHDNEFAENYADRIIRLVDGKVFEDVTYTENSLNVNVCERESSLLVKEGVDLNAEEKDALAKAVKNCKKIELIKELTYRENEPTDQSKIAKTTEKVELQRSKMKTSSAVTLGVKSLGVKPFRLALTILLSAVAFAVFGLFDTLAFFNTSNVMGKLLSESNNVSLYGEYVADYGAEDTYEIKFNEQSLENFEKQLGTKVKGVYGFKDNTSGSVVINDYIREISMSSVSWGGGYYSKQCNGFIEFSAKDFDANKVHKDFGYKVVSGRYPELKYDSNTGSVTDQSLKEIAISTYMVECIMHYLGEIKLDDQIITQPSQLLNKTITVGNETYRIVGFIDCGKIPDKYSVLKEESITIKNVKALIDDCKSFLNSGAYKCVFVAEGRLEALGKKENLYYMGNGNYTATSSDATGTDKNTRHVDYTCYSSVGVNAENALFFKTDRVKDGFVNLGDDEVLINPSAITAVYASEYKLLSRTNIKGRERVDELVYNLRTESGVISLAQKKEAISEIFSLLRVYEDGFERTINLTKSASKTNKSIKKEVKVVGVYVNYDENRGYNSSSYKFMMNENLMDEFLIAKGQGEYSRFILANRLGGAGVNNAVNYMLKEEGISLVWFGNSALDVVRLNEGVIRQAADLFLYAALVLATFSIFMLFNYITTSIANKRQTIGVLRGLGSGSRDILKMFLSESLIIAAINGVLAVAFSWLGCIFVNSYILNVMNVSIPFAFFGTRQVLVILAMSILSAGISSALPILKISKEKPVELIRNV
jgi:ABC-type lipoprotein export system ATPase subunit